MNELESSISPAAATNPLYLAGDNHNIASDGTSWFDHAWMMPAASAASAASSFREFGVSVGNVFGANLEHKSTAAFVADLDDDLGKYYTAHKETADTIGFFVGSMIPGTAGIKALHMAQGVIKGSKYAAGAAALDAAETTGFLGSNLSKATGLLAPQSEMYVAAARNEIAATASNYSMMNKNVLKAIGTNGWQNVLEGAAFETAVQATMSNSPMLKDQDASAIAYSIAVGGFLGGTVGTILGAARITGKLKDFRAAEDAANAPLRTSTGLAQATTPVEKIILEAESRDMAPQALKVTIEGGPDATLAQARMKTAQSLVQSREVNTSNNIRSAITDLVGTDISTGNLLADITVDLDYKELAKIYAHAVEIRRAGVRGSLEAERAAILKETGGNADHIQHSYMVLWGDAKGNMYNKAPLLRPVDTVVNEEGVRELAKSSFRGVDDVLKTDFLRITSTKAQLAYVAARNTMGSLPKKLTIPEHNIPMLQEVAKRAATDPKFNTVLEVISADGKQLWKITAPDQLDKYIKSAKDDLIAYYGTKGMPSKEIAAITDTTLPYVEGTVKDESAMFAHDSRQKAYDNFCVQNNLKPIAESVDFVPQVVKIGYKLPINKNGGPPTRPPADKAIVYAHMQQQVYNDACKVAAAQCGLRTELEFSLDSLYAAGRAGAGPGAFSFASGGMGTVAAIAEYVGSRLTKPLRELKRKEVIDTLETSLYKMRTTPNAAQKFEIANNWAASQPYKVRLIENGESHEFWPLELAEGIESGTIDYDAALKKLQELGQKTLTIPEKEVYEVIHQMQSLSGGHIEEMITLNAARGVSTKLNPKAYSVVRPDAASYPHVAFVDTKLITDGGRKSMLFARSAEDLQKQIDMTRSLHPGIKVYTTSDAEAFYAARKEYEHSLTLHETYVDSSNATKGVYNTFYMKNDPGAIIDSVLAQYTRHADAIARETVRTRYDSAFKYLLEQGEQYTNVALSKVGGNKGAEARAQVENPFQDVVKTALDVSRKEEYPLWQGLNNNLDKAFTTLTNKINTLRAKPSPDLEAINKVMEEVGIAIPYSKATQELITSGKPIFMDGESGNLINTRATRGALTSFVSAQNGILSTITLGLDVWNGIVNTLGSNILRTTEVRHLVEAIAKGDTKIAGELGKLNVPGTGTQMFSPAKLIASAAKDFIFDKAAKARITKEWDLDASLIKNHDDLMDVLTLRGTETDGVLVSKIKEGWAKVQESGPKWTLNQQAEQMNRFVTIRTMEKIVEPAIQKGIISEAEGKVYINTMLNRVEGNITASQRPIAFQGPIGMAVGLFQSYQFNLMQQLLRYVKDGSAKDAAMLLGLQSSLFGLNGLPGFQLINQHIIGNGTGNKEHRDAYDVVMGAAGKDVGEFLLYGVPSNLLQAGIYTRGDVNPRQITILPNSLSDVPLVGAYTKFFSGIKSSMESAAQGAPLWNSFLSGLEHNGISRPMAGIAQVMQGYSTSGKASIVGHNDLLSWASAVRIAGSRPLDEALQQDQLFRYNSYVQADRAKLESLSKAYKVAGGGGQPIPEGSLEKFTESYMNLGGTQSSFNRWMVDQYKNATIPQSQQIAEAMKKPLAQKLQLFMAE